MSIEKLFKTLKNTLFKSEIEKTSKSLHKLKKILKPETKLEVKFNRKKLEKLEKDFGELRHKLSNKDEISEYRKTFYNAKKHKLFESEIGKTNKNLNELIKSLKSERFQGNIDCVDYEDLDSCNNNYDFADDDKYRKIGSIRTLFREFDSDYYKPIRTDDGFEGKKNYIIYKSKGNKYENLSLKEYPDVIRPYLRDLINEHRPIMELNNNTNNSNNNTNNSNNNANNNSSNNTSNSNNEENDRAE